MGVVIAVCGRKGGSGKTTIAIHLAAELATRGRSVVLVDADVQGSAVHWAQPGALPMPVHPLPLETDAAIGDWSRSVRAIAADYLLLDAPPHLNAALGGVIGLADLAVIPCGPSGMDLLATAETVSLVREIRDARKDGRPVILLVPNRADRRTGAGRELAAALADIGEPVAPSVGLRAAFSDAFNVGAWVGAFAPASLAHHELRALADRVLARMEELV